MTNLNEAKLHYPWGDTLPEPGRAQEVAPGVFWLRLPLPFALDHINVWLLRDHMLINGQRQEGWTLVDCGIHKPQLKALWAEIFEHVLQGLPILRVMVTHMHPDHVGLAHWLCEHWSSDAHDCSLWMSFTDYSHAMLGTHGGTGFGGDEAARFFRAHGMVGDDQLAGMRERRDYYRGLVPSLPDHFHRLRDGQTVRIGDDDWQCIVGYGHAPEHIALSQPERKLLISGDMVLPRISTNISVYNSEPEGNPLHDFLTSLSSYEDLDPATLVLPSHGKPFGAAQQQPEAHGLHERIRQLREHHQDRLAEVLEACKTQAGSGMDMIPVIFKRPLDLHQTTFAIGEAIAHLHALWFEGKLVRFKDEHGVWRFSAA